MKTANEKELCVNFNFYRYLFVYNKICTKFALALNKTGLWCNGNTTVFGAVFQGSSPCRPTKKPLNLRGFLILSMYQLNFKGNHWSQGMIYQVFTYATIKKMCYTFSAVRRNSN